MLSTRKTKEGAGRVEGEMKNFKVDNTLKFCGKCPFLIQPFTKVLGSCNQNPIGTDQQENVCTVNHYYWGKIVDKKDASTQWEPLEKGTNPKRKGGCLLLVKHIYSQIIVEREENHGQGGGE